MQKASCYDGSTLFGHFPYGANGFGYEGAQPPFPPSSHPESDFQRSSCSLQSLGGKNKELNGSCMRPGSPNDANGNSATGTAGAGKGKANPGTSISKQIFPWMKESRQNSKQKSGSPGAGSSLGLGEGRPVLPLSGMTRRRSGKKRNDGRDPRVAKGWRNRFREGTNSAFLTQNSKGRCENHRGFEELV